MADVKLSKELYEAMCNEIGQSRARIEALEMALRPFTDIPLPKFTEHTMSPVSAHDLIAAREALDVPLNDRSERI